MDEKTQLYLKYKNKRKLRMFRDLKVTSIALLLLAASLASVGGVSAAISTKPAVSHFVVAPATLNYPGGNIRLSADVKNATKCIFRISPVVAGVNKNMVCRNGRVTYTSSLPKNISDSNIVYTFKLIVIGRKGKGVAVAPLKRVTVVAAPKPVIKSFTASTSGLSNAGGTVTLTGQVTNEIGCSITASPAIEGTSSNIVPCGSGSFTVPVVLPANSSTSQISYRFTLTVNGDVSASSKALTITVYPTPTVPTTPPVTTGNTISVPAQPDALVQAGQDIWVASCKGNAVTEINKSSKQIVQIINSPTYGFSCPDALAFDGTHIWVANKLGSSLTQLNASTGAWIQTITGSGILNPDALAFTGTNLWVSNNSLNGGTSFLSEFNSYTGIVVRIVKGDINQSLQNPECIAFTGTNLWIADSGSGGAFEYTATSGAYLRSTGAGGGGSGATSYVSYHSGYIWISSSNTGTALEFNATSGAYVREISVNSPDQLIFNGSNLFIVSVAPTTKVIEYSSAGLYIRTIVNLSYKLQNGMSILYDNSNLWVANGKDNTVTVHLL